MSLFGWCLLLGGTYWKASYIWAWNRKVLISGEALAWGPALVRGYSVVKGWHPYSSCHAERQYGVRIWTPPPLTSKCGNKYSFVSKEDKKSYFLSYNEYQEISKEHHLYSDKVARNIVLNIIKHEWRTNTNSMKRQTYRHCRPSVRGLHVLKKIPSKQCFMQTLEL